MDWFDEDDDMFMYVVCLFNMSLVIKNYVFSSRTPSKSNVTFKDKLTGLCTKGNYYQQMPSKPKESSSKKPFSDAESDGEDDVLSNLTSKASGKRMIKSKSQSHTNSDDDSEALMSPFEQIDPHHSNKSRR